MLNAIAPIAPWQSHLPLCFLHFLPSSHSGLLSVAQTCLVPTCHRASAHLFPDLFAEFVPTYPLELNFKHLFLWEALWPQYSPDSFAVCSFRAGAFPSEHLPPSAVLYPVVKWLDSPSPQLDRKLQEVRAEPGFAQNVPQQIFKCQVRNGLESTVQ